MLAGMIEGETRSVLTLGLALAIGLLIGVERGWRHREDASGSRVAGVRTFGVLAVLGGVAGLVPLVVGCILLLAAATALLIGFIRQRRVSKDVSATTVLVGMLTMALGFMATTGRPIEAISAGVAITLLLSMRETLHGWLRVLTLAEVQSIGRFALLSMVILPLLPDADYGPLDAWNPRRIWMVVVFVSGFSLLGYVATRKLGARAGLLATAFTGALVSSTAVTMSLARRLRDGSADQASVTAGIALASSVMFLRVSLLTAVLAPFALLPLVRLVLPAALIAMLLAATALRRARIDGDSRDVRLGNPFDLLPAFALAALVAALALAVRWAQLWFGNTGITVVLALTGLADVDAAVLSLSTLPPHSIGAAEAGLALAAPVLLNTLLKGAITIVTAPGWGGLKAATSGSSGTPNRRDACPANDANRVRPWCAWRAGARSRARRPCRPRRRADTERGDGRTDRDLSRGGAMGV